MRCGVLGGCWRRVLVEGMRTEGYGVVKVGILGAGHVCYVLSIYPWMGYDGEVNGVEMVNGECLEAVELRLVELRHYRWSHSALPVTPLPLIHSGTGVHTLRKP